MSRTKRSSGLSQDLEKHSEEHDRNSERHERRVSFDSHSSNSHHYVHLSAVNEEPKWEDEHKHKHRHQANHQSHGMIVNVPTNGENNSASNLLTFLSSMMASNHLEDEHSDPYKAALIKLKLQSELSRANTLINSYFRGHPIASASAVGVLFYKYIRVANRVCSSELVEFTVYHIDDPYMIQKIPGNVSVFEVSVRTIESEPRVIAKTYISYPAVIALLHDDIVRCQSAFAEAIQAGATVDLGWDINSNYDKAIKRRVLERFLAQHVEVICLAETNSVHAELSTDKVKVGEKLAEVLSHVVLHGPSTPWRLDHGSYSTLTATSIASTRRDIHESTSSLLSYMTSGLSGCSRPGTTSSTPSPQLSESHPQRPVSAVEAALCDAFLGRDLDVTNPANPLNSDNWMDHYCNPNIAAVIPLGVTIARSGEMQSVPDFQTAKHENHGNHARENADRRPSTNASRRLDKSGFVINSKGHEFPVVHHPSPAQEVPLDCPTSASSHRGLNLILPLSSVPITAWSNDVDLRQLLDERHDEKLITTRRQVSKQQHHLTSDHCRSPSPVAIETARGDNSRSISPVDTDDETICTGSVSGNDKVALPYGLNDPVVHATSSNVSSSQRPRRYQHGAVGIAEVKPTHCPTTSTSYLDHTHTSAQKFKTEQPPLQVLKSRSDAKPKNKQSNTFTVSSEISRSIRISASSASLPNLKFATPRRIQADSVSNLQDTADCTRSSFDSKEYVEHYTPRSIVESPVVGTPRKQGPSNCASHNLTYGNHGMKEQILNENSVSVELMQSESGIRLHESTEGSGLPPLKSTHYQAHGDNHQIFKRKYPAAGCL